jgi:ribose transport system ATP-binding protein
VLAVRGLQRAFGPTRALDDASLSAEAGSVLAVLGQNGAGKSTLMNILSGALAADSGTITLKNKPFAPTSPLFAKRAGVAMVHQELSLCPHLSVMENVLLDALPTRYGLVDWRAARERAAAVMAPLMKDQPIDLDARVADLSPAQQVLVEVGRALAATDCKLLILDEPTSALPAADVARLFDVIRGLKARGLTILYSSHFLEEIMQIADQYVVLRDGRTVAHGAVADTSIDALVEHLAGRRVEVVKRSKRTPGEVVLRLDDVVGAPLPKRASLALRRGEVLGLAGLVGSGRTETLRAILGLDAISSGKIRVKSISGPASASARLAQGVGMLSEDRKSEGLALSRSIAFNTSLSRLPAFVREADDDAIAAQWVAKLGVKCASVDQAVGELSGGNQQKVAIARLLHADVDVLLLDEPTRGIDVAAKAAIFALVDELAAAGKAVIFVSSYLPELVLACDRVHVVRRGELGPARDGDTIDERALLREASAP